MNHRWPSSLDHLLSSHRPLGAWKPVAVRSVFPSESASPVTVVSRARRSTLCGRCLAAAPTECQKSPWNIRIDISSNDGSSSRQSISARNSSRNSGGSSSSSNSNNSNSNNSNSSSSTRTNGTGIRVRGALKSPLRFRPGISTRIPAQRRRLGARPATTGVGLRPSTVLSFCAPTKGQVRLDRYGFRSVSTGPKKQTNNPNDRRRKTKTANSNKNETEIPPHRFFWTLTGQRPRPLSAGAAAPLSLSLSLVHISKRRPLAESHRVKSKYPKRREMIAIMMLISVRPAALGTCCSFLRGRLWLRAGRPAITCGSGPTCFSVDVFFLACCCLSSSEWRSVRRNRRKPKNNRPIPIRFIE